ncbi:MAG: MFS transporter [Candidatus Brocadiaceae bacterium]|nr:MFS transporter [Candidatus Brocadiaceae bacterium]
MIRFSAQYFLLFALMAAFSPYLQVFLQSLGFSEREVGHLQGLLGLAGICGPMLLGRLADRVGHHKWILAAGLAAYAALLVPLAGPPGFATAAVLAAAIGFVLRPAIPLTDVLAAEALPDPVHQYGRVRAWGSGSFVLSLLAFRAFRLVDEGSPASMMRMMVLTAGLCIVSSFMLPDSRPSRVADAKADPAKAPARFVPAFWLFLLAAGAQRFGMAAYYSFFTLYLRETFAMKQAAWVWALGALVETPVMFFAGRAIRRFGLQRMLIASMLGASLRMAIYAFVPVLPVVLASQALHALTFGFFHGASIEFLRRAVPAERRGLAMALYMSLTLGVTAWLGSSLGGEIIERWGYPALFGSYALVPLAGVALMLAARRSFARACAEPAPTGA